jgi:hypothetical protein
MADAEGFLSYVHKDDQVEGGRISRLGRDIVNQFELLTGESISLFLDKDAIGWGENWRGKIDKSLSSVAFFIPVMTPRYFMSPECRRELQFFIRKTTDLGIKELILPLLYVDVSDIRDETNTDELIVLVRTFQWVDWQSIRFLDVTSEGYRKGVAQLATRLAEANRRAEEVSISSTMIKSKTPDEPVDDSPGLLDRLLMAEETLPKMNKTLNAIGQNIELINQITVKSTDELHRVNAQGQGFGPKLIVARKMAHQLDDPIEQIWSLTNEFASQLHEVDEGFRTIIELALAEIEANPDSRTDVCEFFKMVCGMSASARQAYDSVQAMIDETASIENISRDLRPRLRHLRRGLTIMIEAKDVTDEWVHLIEASDVVCEDLDAPLE